MNHTIDKFKYARLICFKCKELFGDGERFLTVEQYNHQMNEPDKTWRCPSCKCYDCHFDDFYWEKNVGITE